LKEELKNHPYIFDMATKFVMSEQIVKNGTIDQDLHPLFLQMCEMLSTPMGPKTIPCHLR
jgi:hypothetical protein